MLAQQPEKRENMNCLAPIESISPPRMMIDRGLADFIDKDQKPLAFTVTLRHNSYTSNGRALSKSKPVPLIE
jgi:hypothetical protein